MNGWYAQTNLLHDAYKSKQITAKAARIQNAWLEEKIKNLDSDH
jgi:hypothetical protein